MKRLTDEYNLLNTKLTGYQEQIADLTHTNVSLCKEIEVLKQSKSNCDVQVQSKSLDWSSTQTKIYIHKLKILILL